MRFKTTCKKYNSRADGVSVRRLAKAAQIVLIKKSVNNNCKQSISMPHMLSVVFPKTATQTQES